MKLILIDQDNIATIAREEILTDQYHYDVDNALTFDDFKSKYTVGKYHIVILDFAIDAGAKALEYIDKTDPKQRVIVISAGKEYNVEYGCDYCVEHYNRRLLKKPLSVMELANVIREFDDTSCAYYHD
jgi:DNA-binding NtrC family response regulator